MFCGKIIVFAAAVILAMTFIAAAQGPPARSSVLPPTKDRPLLEIDLRKLVGANWNLSNDDKAGATLRSVIEFADNASLIWEWTTRDKPLPPTKKGEPVQLQPAHHHAILLDALTANEKAAQDFYGPLYSVYFRTVFGGRILTCVENKFRIFAPTFELLQEVDSSASHGCTLLQNLGQAGVSPSRRSILVSNRPGRGNHVEILDTGTLTVLSTWNESTSVPITSISDHWQAGLCGNPWEVCVRKLDGSWKAFSFTGPEYQPPTRVLGRAYFVEDDTVLICRLNELAVASVNGSMLFRTELPKDRSCENNVPTISSESGRFALMQNRRLPTNEFLDVGEFWTDDEIVVYDISERRAVFTLKVKGASPWPSSIKHNNAFALSPDGSRLAVVADGILKVYGLPARPSLP